MTADDYGRERVSGRRCKGCAAPLADHPAYFTGAYFRDPLCVGCALEAKWQRLLDWHRTFGGDEEPPPRDADLPALRLPPTGPCEVCTHEIAWLSWRHSGLRVCSYNCRDERTNRRRRVDHEPQACVVCGETFTPRRSDAKTCSDRCRQRLRRSQLSARRALSAANRDKEEEE